MRKKEPDLAVFSGVKAGSLCLDAGAGTGRASKALLAAGARVVLLERNDERLGRAANEIEGDASFVRGDVRSLPFEAGRFDLVVLRAIVHHLADPAITLREAARVTRPGGAVVIVDKIGPEDLPARARRNALERLRHSGHVWSWSEKELRALSGSARLDVEEFESWIEERDADEWIAKGDCAPPWDSIVRELLGGARVVAETWGALRLRKPASRR